MPKRGYGFWLIPAHRRHSAGQVVYSRPTPRTSGAAVDIWIGNTLFDMDGPMLIGWARRGGGARLLQTSPAEGVGGVGRVPSGKVSTWTPGGLKDRRELFRLLHRPQLRREQLVEVFGEWPRTLGGVRYHRVGETFHGIVDASEGHAGVVSVQFHHVA
jgi:hypothetical protein